MQVRLAFVAAATAAVLAALAPGASTAPVNSKIEVGPKAEFVSAALIQVPVTVTCPASFGAASAFVVVNQESTGAEFSFGSTPLMCTGAPVTVVVNVTPGPFALGQATAQGSVGAAGFTDFDIRNIQIVL